MFDHRILTTATSEQHLCDSESRLRQIWKARRPHRGDLSHICNDCCVDSGNSDRGGNREEPGGHHAGVTLARQSALAYHASIPNPQHSRPTSTHPTSEKEKSNVSAIVGTDVPGIT